MKAIQVDQLQFQCWLWEGTNLKAKGRCTSVGANLLLKPDGDESEKIFRRQSLILFRANKDPTIRVKLLQQPAQSKSYHPFFPPLKTSRNDWSWTRRTWMRLWP